MLLAACGGGSKAGPTASDGPSTGGTATTPPPPPNKPPVISGTPPTQLKQDQAYDFQPTASDPEGSPLTFAVDHKPAWASFDITTGRLSGRPSAAYVGGYHHIVISVSDGQATASLPAFSVEVTQASLGKVTVSWIAPVQNTDGTPLTDLSGYRIYYGLAADALDRTVVIDTVDTTTYVIDGLTPATWYFAMTSVNGSGVESAKSAVASKVIAAG